MKNSEKILRLIDPIEEIQSTEDLKTLCNHQNRLTLIEAPFFVAVQPVIHEICENNIAGDIVNIGVFKGGASLFMKSVFEENNIFRKWFLFDSFCGFNEDTLTKRKDLDALSYFKHELDFSENGFPAKDALENLFKTHQLDNHLTVTEGYIENTLEKQPIDTLCFLHIDVDFYEPTLFALNYLYPKLNRGGWVIVDDYHVDAFNCKEAVDEYRDKFNILSPIVRLGNYQIGWRKEESIFEN